MKSTRTTTTWLAGMLVILATILAPSVLVNGQEGKAQRPKGIVWDWTHHHVVFSNPGNGDDAMRKGTYERWLKITSDPRYLMQQQERGSGVRGRGSGLQQLRTSS